MPDEAIITENRKKAVKWLRTTKRKQGKGSLYNPYTRCYCALGHVGLAVGIDSKVYPNHNPYSLIEAAVDLARALESRVIRWNDSYDIPLKEIGNRLAKIWELESPETGQSTP